MELYTLFGLLNLSEPVGVGFGVRDAKSAKEIASVADAVIVGSALIRQIEAHLTDDDTMKKNVATLVKDMRDAMDSNARVSDRSEVTS